MICLHAFQSRPSPRCVESVDVRSRLQDFCSDAARANRSCMCWSSNAKVVLGSSCVRCRWWQRALSKPCVANGYTFTFIASGRGSAWSSPIASSAWQVAVRDAIRYPDCCARIVGAAFDQGPCTVCGSTTGWGATSGSTTGWGASRMEAYVVAVGFVQWLITVITWGKGEETAARDSSSDS